MMSPLATHAVAMAGMAVVGIAGLCAGFRLRGLMTQGAVKDALAAYYAPMAGGPVVFRAPFDLKGAQRSRMIQGRMIRLVFSSDHREIGDRWLSRWVLVQRSGLVVVLAALLGSAMQVSWA